MNGNLFAGDRTTFGDLQLLERAIDDLFGGWPASVALRSSGPGSFPAVNVGATPEAVHVYVLVPGVEPAKLDVNIQAGALSISGTRPADNGANRRYYRQERFRGDFRRVIALPPDVDPDRVEANYTNGVLHITVHRRESARPRQIEIK